ncbi:MAG TPA: beta-ketoacyl-[acyl-carrier-protein] synthase family protein [Thermoleophilaceae bacterium]|jgi:3-oxoacyl-[acyl-carrier-protein] synthase II
MGSNGHRPRERRGVVITGVGAVTPLGIGARTLFDRWTAGVCAIDGGVARCEDFDPRDTLSKKELRRTDRYTQFAIVAAEEAVRQAGWDGELPYPADRIATVTGTGIGGVTTLENNVERRLRGERISAYAIASVMPNAASAAASLRYGLKGPNFSVVSACAAGAHAIGTAMRLIEEGEADAAITGGAEAPHAPTTQAGFETMGAISPSGTARPFDARRDGFVMGEGSAMLVLEEAEAARRRGAHVLGELVGYGATDDAFNIAIPEPNGRGAARAMRLALEDAGLAPEAVSYVNAHGTSTPVGDVSETEAIKTALGDHAMRTPVSSLKSSIGHSLGASGAIEAVATLLAMRERVLPPTLGWEEAEEGLDLDYVPERARPLEGANGDGAVAISNSFGFGGHNAVLCLVA